MNTPVQCRDCRFWRKRHLPRWLIERDSHPNYGECELADSSDGKPENVQTLAFASDYEGYQAILLTSPEFGCVQGQQQEDTSAEPPR